MTESRLKAVGWIKQSRSLGEGVAESTTACLLAMVQGNILALSMGHLIIATQTGIIAGLLAFVVTVIARFNNPWMIALVLGVSTTIVDYMVHPGSFGGVATEAIVTGLGAGLLSYLVTIYLRSRNSESAHPSS